ncbi:MAG: alpha-hydroxy-acid oxidizing protein, partial [Hyphomicrobiales bacterium]|nr:alpha-hydroxy-acid oxidizing protein [Hyphomicrobiales bacterium]
MNKPVSADETTDAATVATSHTSAEQESVLNAVSSGGPVHNRALGRCLNIADLREAARKRLPRCVFEFFDRGSEDEVALRNNREAFQRIRMRNKVMVDVSRISTATALFGKPSAMPLAIAPTGVAGVCWYEGEIELAKAAAKAGVPFTLATPTVTALEKIAAVEGGRNWFQLYMWRERELSHALVKRARDAGFEALILTADTPVTPIREYNVRNGFSLPFKSNATALVDMALHPRWLIGTMGRYWFTTGMPKLAHYPDSRSGVASPQKPGKSAAPDLRGDNLGWDDIRQLRDLWKGPLLLKGVHLAEDAARAVAEGVDGIVVSNHGGRNLESAVAPIEILPEIVA